MCHLKEGKKSRFIVSKILYVVCYISGSVCRKSNAVWSRLLIMFFFISFIFLFYSKVSAVAEVMCALSRINSMVYWEKKSCDTVSWLQTSLWQTLCSKSFSRHWKKNKWKKKRLLTFQQTLEVHVIALNFYDTWLCHIFMDKCNDGCPQKKEKMKKKNNFFTTKRVRKFQWIVRKWLIVL